MKARMKMMQILLIVFIVLIGVIVFLGQYSPNRLIEYHDTALSPMIQGEQTVFLQGKAYHRQSMLTQVSVTGTHYDMGLQYGVLLKDEIREMVKQLRKIISFYASEMKVPENVVYFYMQVKINKLAHNLPTRFQDEIRGISEGAGVSEEAILTISLFDDLVHSMGCTSVVARTKDGGIVHGRNEDLFYGELLGGKQVIVEYHPQGYRSVVSVAFPGFVGVSSGINDQGLAYSHHSRFAKGVDTNGLPQHCIARMALEECCSLEEVEKQYQNSSVDIGDAHTWSDRKKVKGCVIETAPSARQRTKVWEMGNEVLWHINLYLNTEYQQNEENILKSKDGFNLARQEMLLDAIPAGKNTLEVDDVIALLRRQTGVRGENYNQSSTARGICNIDTQLMVVFDPSGCGMYLAYGKYMASRNVIYFIPYDFSKEPTMYKNAEQEDLVVDEVCAVLNSPMTHMAYIEELNKVLNRYPAQGYVQYLVAKEYYAVGDYERWAEAVEQTVRLSSRYEEQEVRLAQIKVSMFRGETRKAIAISKEMQSEKLLSIKSQAEYLYLMMKAYEAEHDNSTALRYQYDYEKLINDEKERKQIQSSLEFILRRY